MNNSVRRRRAKALAKANQLQQNAPQRTARERALNAGFRDYLRGKGR